MGSKTSFQRESLCNKEAESWKERKKPKDNNVFYSFFLSRFHNNFRICSLIKLKWNETYKKESFMEKFNTQQFPWSFLQTLTLKRTY